MLIYKRNQGLKQILNHLFLTTLLFKIEINFVTTTLRI